MDNIAGITTNFGTLLNAGTLANFDSITVAATGILNNSGTFNNDHLLTIAGTLYNAPGASITNNDFVTSVNREQ